MGKLSGQYKHIRLVAEQSPMGIHSVLLDYAANSSAASNKIARAANAAIAGKKLPVKLDLSWASDFQKRVYRELMKIKPGQVITYKQLAEKIGHPKAARAVASACARNRLPIFIPCHRVVASHGGMGGYSGGGGIKTKKYLLQLEGAQFAK